MSLASRLPYDHPYAGGYPGIGSQPLPTDADAIDYLSRMATADGAGVEVGVAVAVDAFFRDTKAAGVFDALKACCILAGARTLAGALVPVVGDAPTNVANGFVNGDFSRTAGLTGDGTSYIDSGRANDADPQDDQHLSVYIASPASSGGGYIGVAPGTDTGATHLGITAADGTFFSRNRASAADTTGDATSVGLVAMSRASSSAYTFRSNETDVSFSKTSQTPYVADIGVFTRLPSPSPLDATIAFYSIGTAISLSDLDTAVTNLITAIGEAL